MSIAFDRNIITAAVRYGRKTMNRAYSLDFGITDSGVMMLVEVNEAFALGTYGLPSIIYARMLETRWQEIMHD